MGKPSRDKGRRGQTAAKDLLASRDWVVADLSAGIASEDILATDTDGSVWAVEVKNTVAITPAKFRRQAMEQAKKRRARWMVMAHIDGSSCFLVDRQGFNPVVWCDDK